MGAATLALVTGLSPQSAGADEVAAQADDIPGVLPRVATLQVVLRANHAERFGGMWIDSFGRLTVAMVGDDRAIREAVSDAGLTEPTVFKDVEFSESDLEETHASIVADADETLSLGTIELAGIETDIVKNTVVLMALDPAPNEIAALKSVYGRSVAVVPTTERALANACTNSNCPNPLKAGLRLYQNGTYHCMGAFIMRSVAGTYYQATGGHCSSLNDVYQHPAGTNRGSVTHQGWVSNSPVDVALFSIASSQKSNKLCVFTSCSIINVTSRENPASGTEIIGQRACVARQTTATCGDLKSVNNTISICQPGTNICRTITWLRRASYTTGPGDSGAAVYYSSEALGVHSATYPASTDGLYSHIINVESYFYMQTQLTP